MTQPEHASRQIAGALRADIEAGVYPPGSKIPSYRQLRDTHHVAVNTALAAVRILADEGLVEIRPAKGAYVRDPANTASPAIRAELSDLQAQLRRSRKDLADAERTVTDLLARLPSREPAR